MFDEKLFATENSEWLEKDEFIDAIEQSESIFTRNRKRKKINHVSYHLAPGAS